MRKISNRLQLSPVTLNRLASKTQEILASADKQARAEILWKSSRKTEWFKAITSALGSMTGLGERCMYCSGSESAQVEHYDPKAHSPQLAFTWSNHLWICGICNLQKGVRFKDPSVAGIDVFPIDPVAEDPWDFFFIDEYGNLTEKWDPAINNVNIRARWTIDLMGLDRQALQECRQARLVDLREKVSDTLRLHGLGQLTIEDLERRMLEWFEQPFQPDIADYFFAGPGSADILERFWEILLIIEIG